MKFLEGGAKSLIGDFIATYFLYPENVALNPKEELVLFFICGMSSKLNLKGEKNIIFIAVLFWSIMLSQNIKKSDNLVKDIIIIIIAYNIFKGLIDDDILISILLTLYYLKEEEWDI